MGRLISVVIPVYNEERALEKTLDDAVKVMKKAGVKHEIIAVDDGSTDRSRSILKWVKGVNVVTHPYNMGYGAAIKTGVRHAKGEWVLITDADGTYPLEEIPKLLKDLGKYDMVVGARTGEKVSIPKGRRPGKWVISKVANYLAGKKIPDLNSGFRIFRKEVAERFMNILPSKFSFTSTITLACMSSDYTVNYVSVNYHPRKGKSKIKPFRDGSNFILLIIRTIMYFKPLKIFLPAALVLFLLGLGVLVRDIVFLGNVAELSVMLILAAIQIGFFGFIADLVVKQRR